MENYSTCPICKKKWAITPMADCFLPGCGCYGHDTSEKNSARPCWECGLQHAFTCPKMKSINKKKKVTN
jgi:hypothetical protein